jgi:hypothetical protein
MTSPPNRYFILIADYVCRSATAAPSRFSPTKPGLSVKTFTSLHPLQLCRNAARNTSRLSTPTAPSLLSRMSRMSIHTRSRVILAPCPRPLRRRFIPMKRSAESMMWKLVLRASFIGSIPRRDIREEMRQRNGLWRRRKKLSPQRGYLLIFGMGFIIYDSAKFPFFLLLLGSGGVSS